MRYLTVAEIAEKWRISPRRVQILCRNGRIPTALKIGHAWIIPDNVSKPVDARYKNSIEKNDKTSKNIENFNSLSSSIGAIIIAEKNFNENHTISPFFEIGNLSLIRRIVITFQQVGVTNIVVVTGHCSWEIEHHLANYGVIFLKNENYETTDRFSSIKIGLHFLKDKCEKIFFTSLQIPMFMPDTLKAMIQSDSDMIIPQYQGKNEHPLLINIKAIPEIFNYNGEEGMQGVIKNCNCKKEFLTVEDKGVLLSISNISCLEKNIEEINNDFLYPYIRISIEKNSSIFDERAKLLFFLIKEFHSVQSACKQMAISKGKAWEIITNIEKQLNVVMIQRKQGGSRDRKTKLTLEGEEFLKFFKEYEENVKNYAIKQFKKSYKLFKDKVKNKNNLK